MKKLSYDRKNKQLTNFQDLHSFVIENYIKTIQEEKKPKDKDRQTILGWYSLIRKGEQMNTLTQDLYSITLYNY